MESEGEANKIQVAPAAAGLMASDPELGSLMRRRPGGVFVKGQGWIQSSWLQTGHEAMAASHKRSQVLEIAERGRWSKERVWGLLGGRSMSTDATLRLPIGPTGLPHRPSV